MARQKGRNAPVSLALPNNVPSLLIFPQPDKLRMSQVTIRRPFGELDLCDQLWFKPHAVFHFFLCQRPLRPFALELRASSAVGLRCKRFSALRLVLLSIDGTKRSDSYLSQVRVLSRELRRRNGKPLRRFVLPLIVLSVVKLVFPRPHSRHCLRARLTLSREMK
jgi:hypothetical protein